MNKKGISVMVGYVILISIVVVIGTMIYLWLRSFTPVEEIDCGDDISIAIKSLSCDERVLKVVLENKGLFNIDGFFIYAKDSPDREIATKNLVDYLDEGGERKLGKAVQFIGEMKPNDQKEVEFDLSSTSLEVYGVEISPAKFERIGGKLKFVNCGNAKISENIVCVP